MLSHFIGVLICLKRQHENKLLQKTAAAIQMKENCCSHASILIKEAACNAMQCKKKGCRRAKMCSNPQYIEFTHTNTHVEPCSTYPHRNALQGRHKWVECMWKITALIQQPLAQSRLQPVGLVQVYLSLVVMNITYIQACRRQKSIFI